MTGGGSETPGDLVSLDANGLYLAILQISRIITHAPSIDQVYEKFALELKKLVDFDRANITTIDAAAGTLTIAHNFGQQLPGFPAGQVAPLEGTRAGLVRVTRQTFVEHDVAAVYSTRAPDVAALEVGLRSSIVVPLICQGQVIGALSIRSRRAGAFGPREQVLIEHLARLIAPAVDRVKLSERVSRLTNGQKDQANPRQPKAGHGPEAGADTSVPAPPREGRLSPREQDVLALLAMGTGNQEIGVALSISRNTVKTHVSNILGKLKVRNRTEAAQVWLGQAGTG
ncbi:MAG TPA: LuxR C-terminal-related transcriptional regulator [Dehalococcoidia bacterium]|nr:LuxR C-terminal-related transcriptional regulator [Dehalococcoidia bacterium]